MTQESPITRSGSHPVDNVDWTKVGELLLLSQLITRENLQIALSLAIKMRMPLGRILSMHGYLNEKLIANAVELQDMIKSGALTQDAAIRALKSVSEGSSESLSQVLDRPRENVSLHQPLGETLRSIGAISNKQLNKGLSASLETGLPIGWVLASQGFITENLLGSAISAQRLMEQNLLPVDQALNCLRMARLQQKDFRKVLSEQSIDTQAIDPELLLTHLLVKSGAALRTEVLACREFALLHNASLERYLFNFGILSEDAFTAVQAVFAKVSEASLTAAEGVEILEKLKRVGWNMARLDATPAPPVHVETTDLLGLTGLVTKQQLDSAVEKSTKEQQPLSKVLVEEGFLEQVAFDALETCKKFVNANHLHLHKALAVIPYCADNQCTVDEAILRFGWTPIKG